MSDPTATSPDGLAPGLEADPASTSGETYQLLSSQYIAFERRTGYIGALVLQGILMAASAPLAWLGRGFWWTIPLLVAGWIVAFLLLLGYSYFWPPIAFRHARWRLSESGMEIRRGVLWRHWISIPTARVQHVDVSQGPIQRMFDLATLTIHTAGTSNATVELDGLEYSRATEVRDRLIEQKELLDVT